MRYPLEHQYPITDDYAAHLDRNSKAPGVDIACPLNTPVLAVADGYVTSYGWSEAGGQYVWIRYHLGRNRWAAVYCCHLLYSTVNQWQRVKAGQIIAYSGSTGNSTGPHLHVAVRQGGGWVDPETVWKGEDNA